MRLADTDLVIEVERDFTTYGEEVKFGGGKVIRDGMGQSQRTRAEGADRITLSVANTGDRPIQVGSHYHFAETNAALRFDRDQARGRRLDIAPGTAVRFEPGSTREVVLVPYGGKREVYGFRQDVMGALS